MDLRQFGLLLLVSRQDYIPLLHKVYQGNISDKTVFIEQFKNMLNRFNNISGSLEELTLVFDQGNNSKKTLKKAGENIRQRIVLNRWTRTFIHLHKVWD